MAKIYEANQWTDGTFSVVPHPVKGVVTKKNNGALTAADGLQAVEKAVAYAKANKVGLDRWSFYVAGESEKLSRGDLHTPTAVVEKALKDGRDVTVEFGKFSHPRITLRVEGDTGKRTQARAKVQQAVIA